MREIEPHATGVAALHSRQTGVVDFARVASAFADDLAARGGRRDRPAAPWRASTAPARTRSRSGTRAARPRRRAAVVCAGAWADRLAVAGGAPAEPRIVPFRGAYLRLRARARATSCAPTSTRCPDPDLPFLGAHLTRGIDGEVLLGPIGADGRRPRRLPARAGARRGTARDPRLAGHVAARAAGSGAPALTEMRARSQQGLVRRGLRSASSPSSQRRATSLPGPAGVRAQALARDGSLVDDFVVHRTERAVHVRNAPSPAATSSLALARLIADEAESDSASLVVL